ncbi:hypothetical protein KVV02_008515 [Mortierella alpina]|uniref:biotin synthase n=1 Tax=Mortierella alpina TaxID=64518 RepID=A0A9P8A4D4_MORAP|nr:hypothetical protein KVV02_008515 [Mortierella alpina]
MGKRQTTPSSAWVSLGSEDDLGFLTQAAGRWATNSRCLAARWYCGGCVDASGERRGKAREETIWFFFVFPHFFPLSLGPRMICVHQTEASVCVARPSSFPLISSSDFRILFSSPLLPRPHHIPAMSLASLRSLSARALKISHSQNAAFQLSRSYTAASSPAKFATIDESPRAQKQMAFGRELSAAALSAHGELRYDWKKEEIDAIYHSPIMELLYHGANVHRIHFDPLAVQQCTLLSIKTGGCSEDCKYCPQSSSYSTVVKAQKMLDTGEVLEAARAAKAAGSTRFCMGAAWRDLAGRKSNFKKIVGFVKEIRAMDMEVCCTLGMLNDEQAGQLKDAGLTAYNHNLDTSREYYPKIITTRSYDERLETISKVRDAGISVCSGGIIGLGETDTDRVGMLHTLSTMPSHPESVPVNALLAVEGTPLEKQEPVKVWDMVRMIATARIVMPKTMIRLSAGRVRFTEPEQALCFMAGANSIFTGDKLLTTPNNKFNADQQMFDTLGLVPKAASFKVDLAADSVVNEKKECCGSKHDHA